MDMDAVRVAFGKPCILTVSNAEVSASLARLCEARILTPFGAPIIIRTLLRGPHRIRPRPSSPAGQILTSVADNGTISARRMIQLVRRRNSLVTFVPNDEASFSESSRAARIPSNSIA